MQSSSVLLTDISSPAKLPATSDFFTNIMFFFYSTLKGDFCWYLLDEPSNIFTALEGKFVSVPHPFGSVRFTFILHNLLAFSLTSFPYLLRML